MDEARIKELYRQHTQTQSAVQDDQLVEDILAVLSRSDWSAEEVSPLDRVATSALSSDIARVVIGLGPDIDSVARDIRQQRAPRVVTLQRYMRRGVALAAGVGALAVLFALVHEPAGQQMQIAPGNMHAAAEADPDVIMAVSFEAADRGRISAAPAREDAIFRGNFDS